MNNIAGFTFSEEGLKCRKTIRETTQAGALLTLVITLGTFFVTFYSAKPIPKDFQKTLLTNANWDMLASALEKTDTIPKRKIISTIGFLIVSHGDEIEIEEGEFWRRLMKTYERSIN